VPERERYTHGYAEAVLGSHSRRTVANSLSYGRHLLRRGVRVLDLGCGPGTISTQIADLVAPGEVTAVDVDPGVLERARAMAGPVPNLTFQLGDAYALGFADDTFDLSHAHQVLQHLADPVAALRELARVTRPGGTIAVRDADYGAFSWSPEFPGLDHWRTLYRSVARANGGEPDAGRYLLAWAHAAGLAVAWAGSSTWTFSSTDGAQWWGRSWAERAIGAEFAEQAIGLGLVTPAELSAIGAAWRQWAEHPDASFVVPHGELLITC
jgi:Methylase involved in ubiquinone/menaquinone biosynthesis